MRTSAAHRRLPLVAAALITGLLVAAAPARAADPWIGIALGNATGGVAVTRVLPTSPAEGAGLKRGDVITFVNGIQVLQPSALLAVTGKASVGQTLSLNVTRGGRAMTLSLKVGTRPPLAELIRLYLLHTAAPDFELPLVNRAGTLKLSSLRGKVVLLYFWASWCDSCKLNMPSLKGLHQRYGGRGLVIYSMGQDKQFATLKKTAADLSLPFVVAHNAKNRVGLLYKSKNVPTTILVDKQGIIREYVQGSSFSFSKLEATLRKYL